MDWDWGSVWGLDTASVMGMADTGVITAAMIMVDTVMVDTGTPHTIRDITGMTRTVTDTPPDINEALLPQHRLP
jgi:hypothetical protein